MEPTIEFIRNLVRRTLEELGLADAAPTGESLLTLAGYYVGREFRFAGGFPSSLPQEIRQREQGQRFQIPSAVCHAE